MFLADEFAARRNRTSRISISLLVAVVAITSSSLMISGLISAAHAADMGTAVDGVLISQDNSFLQLASSPILSGGSAVHAPNHADQQIMRGLTAMLLALMATSGLAVWHRRLRGVFGSRR
ncbi:hypothetical protein QTL95_23155 [Rhizobium sp. S152]|uniref:hypothetical protein n=1 Tax=Rhizobium sp. S152 TaxID=3055038 RepID=UPI0025A97972|nr:hypothetical protein [Rhizobium sp. S152]MDM9628798.1 hypothetical protein [Rhizobium sp. S152]